jgi:hypothetical protein
VTEIGGPFDFTEERLQSEISEKEKDADGK